MRGAIVALAGLALLAPPAAVAGLVDPELVDRIPLLLDRFGSHLGIGAEPGSLVWSAFESGNTDACDWITVTMVDAGAALPGGGRPVAFTAYGYSGLASSPLWLPSGSSGERRAPSAASAAFLLDSFVMDCYPWGRYWFQYAIIRGHGELLACPYIGCSVRDLPE